MQNFDICIIGSGPGGYVAAIAAGRKGKKVALIEKENLGGTCLNVGCIPTKTLLASTDILNKAKNAEEFGVNIDGEISYSWQKMQERKSSVVEQLKKGIDQLLKNANVTVYNGTGSFEDTQTISISNEGETIEKIYSEKTIIATGSKPTLPNFLPESENILSSKDLLELEKVPNSLIVLGGGVIGCEFACLMAELGSTVTIVEMLPNILSGLDKEVSKQLSRELKKKKIKILTGKAAEDIQATADGVSVKVGRKEISADRMLVSVGRQPCTDNLNPEAAGINIDSNGFIQVNNKCETNIENIFAIGDVTGRIQLAHLASAMGITAAENTCEEDSQFNDEYVPNCVYTHPETASVGLSEEECTEKGIDYKKGKFPYSALGKAMAINETSGFCKILSDANSDVILGVHIIGSHATDLISEATAAIEKEYTAEELGRVIHPHPTLGELTMEASHAVHDKSVHLPLMKNK